MIPGRFGPLVECFDNLPGDIIYLQLYFGFLGQLVFKDGLSFGRIGIGTV